jgi:steroid 5-alpha reductase family enzyme
MSLNLMHYFLIALGINVLMFIPAYIFKTDKFTDISYGLTFIILVIIAWLLYPFTYGNTILALMITVWGLRLGIFLFIRIGKMKRDKRFDGIRESFPKFLQFWILQGVSVWIILIPTLLFMGKEEQSISYAGVAVWALGLLLESISDMQKFKFSQNANKKGQFINEGLWKYSRHPNYFGEILCWLGVYLFVFMSFSRMEMIPAFAGPLYIMIILLFGTGIPTVEKQADKKWGDQPDYLEYKRKTSILIPWLRRK